MPFRVGGTVTDVFGEETHAPDLVRVRLVLEVGRPGADPVVAVRTLVDRAPDAAVGAQLDASELAPLPADEAGPLFMGQFHHLMVSTGGADRRDHVVQRALSAEFAGTAMASEDAISDYRWSDLLWPVAVADASLVVASEAAVVPAVRADDGSRAYVDVPRVYLATFGRDARDPEALGFATDLLIDDVAIVPSASTVPGVAARLRLWYGALQTALETELTIRRAALFDVGDRVVDAVSVGSPGDLTLLTPEDATTLPATASRSLRQSLADGSFAVLAGDPATARAWWTIDPDTGRTRSILDPGLGGIRGSGTLPSPRSMRTMDSSYTHGRGPRLPPRPPMQRPPGGGSFRGAPCRGGSEETIIICGVSIPGAIALRVALGVVIVALLVWCAAVLFGGS
jgi:hypothetical protein